MQELLLGSSCGRLCQSSEDKQMGVFNGFLKNRKLEDPLK